MKRVIVCSPYRGHVEANVARARAACREVALSGAWPLAPHLLFPQFLDDRIDAERDRGIWCGLAWLTAADELLVVGDVTDGMRREMAHASELGIPVTFAPEEHAP